MAAPRKTSRKSPARGKPPAASGLERALEERDQALRFQAATAEILASLSRSRESPQPVFDAIVENVRRLFGTRYAVAFLLKGGQLDLVAVNGDARFEGPRSEAGRRFRASFPQPIDSDSFTGKALRAKRVMQLSPIVGNPEASPRAVALAETFGYNSMVVAPLMRDGQVIGAISTNHPEARRYSERELQILKSFADQAVIAIENARLFNETREALDRQTATADILKVISGSPTDLQPVFEAILSHSIRLCDGDSALLWRYDGEKLRFAAEKNCNPAHVAHHRENPLPLGAYNPTPHAALERRTIQVADVFAQPGYRALIPASQPSPNAPSVLAVPLVRGAELLGVISIWRRQKRAFLDKQVAMVQTFADQAVIAIENVRLFNETKDALERQTATSEILKVISSSTTDTQPVFEAIVRSAARLFPMSNATIFMRDGDLIRLRATEGATVDEAVQRELASIYPIPFNPDVSTSARAMVERRINICLDTESPEVPEHIRRAGRAGRFRSNTVVPLVRDDEGIGTIVITHPQPGHRLNEKQLALLRTFADQAVIAIENTRLFNETKEALERQTATSEILAITSRSPTDVQPVLDAVAERAARLCGAADALIMRVEEQGMRRVAHVGPIPSVSERRPLTPGTPTGRAILDRRTIHIADIRDELARGNYLEAEPLHRAIPFRTLLSVPLVRESVAIGAITIRRLEVQPFSDEEIGLVNLFADQAAIAIENTRLFNETKEALERQTATAEILRVIAASPGDIKPVLRAVADNAARLCDATDVLIRQVEDGAMRAVEHVGPIPLSDKAVAPPITRHSIAGRAILECRTIHVPDVSDPAVRAEYPDAVFLLHQAGAYRTVLDVPMVREGRAVGVLVIRREQVRPFSEQQIRLLQTFADQAVIAIENVRLFNELEARNKALGESLEQQKASADVLSVISSSIADTAPVFDRILDSCERLFAGRLVGINLVDEGGLIRIGAYHGPGREQFEKIFPLPLDPDSGTGLAILERRVLHYPDVARPDVPLATRRGCAATGLRACAFAPMLWEGRGLGAIFVGRDSVGEYSDKEIALLKTFADQAAIAIQNARLFREIEDKSRQLEIANKHKSEFLANMSHELRTPLNAIIGFSEVLIERMFGEVNEKQLDYLKDIHESGRHLLSLINDILDLSKIEAGRMELELSRFDLPAAIGNAVTLVRERAQRHGIRLGQDIDARLGEFQADERKVKQILLNLLSNAVKFTPDGGRVDVSARLDTDRVEIAVRDSGVGIAPEDQARLFEEFRQVGHDAGRKAEGTGLGLALTRKFVELHGGEIRVQSAPGSGSTFTVSLPLR